jgi:murein DD-endopeptidase MepM/ murein hydrolase activator NlpD
LRKVKKYYYNADTHRFEKLVVSWRVKLLRVFGFLSTAMVTALIIVAIAFRFLDSPKERQMRLEVQQLRSAYIDLQKQMDETNSSLAQLEQRDNNIYRAIFESAPLPDSIRVGKQYSKIDPQQFAYTRTNELMEQVSKTVQSLSNRVKAQQSSYDTLERMVKAKEKMLTSIPAIQPVSNKTLEKLASGFGYRIDPIYKMPKMHTGLDFTAAQGTPIYATGDGVVSTAGFDDGGYGNHIIINHGYGYETLYGHMVRIKARRGDKVLRGEVIGWVGNTGKSTGPHCHYEVIKNGNKINPIHFFYNDLSATDYERLVRIAAASNQAFD